MPDLDRCYASALKILGFRFNSVQELKRKLAAKAFDQETITATIKRLVAEKWLDDERYASALVRVRARKRVGRLRIRRELRAAGVNDESANTALSENIAPDDERTQLVELCDKKIRMMTSRSGEEYVRSDEGRNKLTSYLLRQGYEFALVLQVMRERLKR